MVLDGPINGEWFEAYVASHRRSGRERRYDRYQNNVRVVWQNRWQVPCTMAVGRSCDRADLP